MKSEELLNSLDHIGEDLLAEAEQNILVRTRRPWLKTAVAAVLVAAIGVGGWLTLNHFTMKSSVQATDPVSATEPAQQTTEPVQSVTLPMLEIGDSWETLPPQREHCRSENAITFSDPAVTALPVYTVDPEHDDFSYYKYNESQLRSILNETLRSLGVSRTGEFRPVHQSNDSSEDLVFINMEVTTGIGTISVTPAGSIYLEFTEPRNLSEIKELLNYPADSYVYSTDAAMDQRQLRLIPALDEPVEQLLVWFFGGVYLYTDQADLNTAGIEAISWYYRANEDWSGYSEPWRVCLGDYPLLSLEEARAYALNGYYLSSDYFYGPLTEELLTDVELIYSEFNFPQNKISGIQLPYYRFWINADLFGECSVCVPAVRPEFISDWEPGDEPAEPNTPAEGAPQLVKLDNGAYEVRGPAGSVEALQYAGIPEQEPIYTDVDQDGETELIYLFYGPSSDPHTEGIAVYGLSDDLPVLKASEILLLNGYQARLVQDKRIGTVWFVLDPSSSAPDGTEGVRLTLTVSRGYIQLTGANLPEGCERDWMPKPTEEEIAAAESALTGEYFSRLTVNKRIFFSDGRTRIWLENDAVLKKDLSTGEIETLFSLEPNAEIETLLLGVTENRLYFGWNEVEDWWGENVYSVNFRNEDRMDIGNALEYSFANGLLVLENFRTDVRPVTVQVIDGRDRKVVQYNVCWCSAFVDGSLYFVYMPELQEYGKLEGVPAEFRDRDVTLSYAVCRVDPDGSVTELGAIQRNYPNGWNKESAWIDPETHTISFDYTGICYDLFTLALKTDELPEDLHELVVEDFSAQDRYTDDCGNVMDYSYSIPRLDANTQGARAINAAIGKQTEELRQWAEEHEDGGYSISVYSLSYEVYVWQDVVSVVMKKSYYYDYTEYFVYCYDSATGRRLDTAELLEKLGVSEADFLDACRTKFREKYQALTGSMPEGERSQYEKDFPDHLPDSPKRVNLELAVYPDESGELIAVAPITSWVGAAFYYHLIPVLDIQN
jgi:hypothetical protein